MYSNLMGFPKNSGAGSELLSVPATPTGILEPGQHEQEAEYSGEACKLPSLKFAFRFYVIMIICRY